MLYEYIWIDGFGNLRGKTRYGDYTSTLENIPEWNFDGSSTNQANGNYSEIILKPVCIINDPFRENESFLVLCDTYLPNGNPTSSNTRYNASKIFEKYSCE